MDRSGARQATALILRDTIRRLSANSSGSSHCSTAYTKLRTETGSMVPLLKESNVKLLHPFGDQTTRDNLSMAYIFASHCTRHGRYKWNKPRLEDPLQLPERADVSLFRRQVRNLFPNYLANPSLHSGRRERSSCSSIGSDNRHCYVERYRRGGRS